MSKKTKRLAILLGILVVLAAVYGVILVANQRQAKKEAEEADIAENGFLVKEMDVDKITGFSYQHPHDEEFSDQTYVFTKQGKKWYYKDDKDFPVNQTVLDTKLEDISKVYAKRLLEETDENFAAYGLDHPALIVSVTDGKETVTYNIGNYNEATADYYMNVEGTDKVYTVDATLWVAFGMELYDMVQMDKFPEIQLDHITRMQIKNADQELDFSFEVTGSNTDSQTGKVTNTGTWYIQDAEGKRVKANQNRTTALASSLVDLSYVQEVAYDCPDDKLADYGLADPNVTVTIDYTVEEVDMSSVQQVEIEENLNEIHYDSETVEKQLTLLVGNATEGYIFTDDYYVKTGDDSSIVTIETALAETLMGLQRDDFVAVTSIPVD